jgi:DNA-binding NarL/FixJ family response regulator
MLGHDDEYVEALERAHNAYVSSGDTARAARLTWWIGHNALFRGQVARAGGWFSRGQRLVEEIGTDCVERGYMLIPLWLNQMGRGDHKAGYATAVEVETIATRFGDADLLWLARDDQGRALVNLGEVAKGLRLVDEALIVAASGELSPIVTGIVYCNTIAYCRDAFELRHVQEWTQALTVWCERQPEMIAHNGLCFVHRAEMTQLRGNWAEAMDQAREAAERFTQGALNQIAHGQALYRQGEIYRLRGEFSKAENAFKEASGLGYDPQPGMALLRLAQGKKEAAAAAIRRAVAERTQPLERVAVLPAYVEITVAAGELDRASAACNDLDEITQVQSTEALRAIAANERGRLSLAQGDPGKALEWLRRAVGLWHSLQAPYEVARAKVLIADACRELGDDDSAALELEAARDAFERLDAKPDLARLGASTHRLTQRELEVLRLVATGKSNRQIATSLTISEHTVARHVQNIFAKTGVTSRTEAGAFAHEHDLA